MPLPRIIYKTRENNGDGTDALPNDNDQWFSDEQVDVIAAALAQSSIALRNEMQAAIDKAVTELRAEKNLHEAVAELRGQLAAVMASWATAVAPSRSRRSRLFAS
jgi:hypothetical protein